MEKLSGNDRIKDKVEEIEKYLEELYSVEIGSLDDYKADFKIRAICERYFEKIVEAVEDLAFFVARDRGIEIVDEDKVFGSLAKGDIISDELAGKLKEAKGMRNIIAHEYGEIDDGLVYETITGELEGDVREFLGVVG